MIPIFIRNDMHLGLMPSTMAHSSGGIYLFRILNSSDRTLVVLFPFDVIGYQSASSLLRLWALSNDVFSTREWISQIPLIHQLKRTRLFEKIAGDSGDLLGFSDLLLVNFSSNFAPNIRHWFQGFYIHTRVIPTDRTCVHQAIYIPVMVFCLLWLHLGDKEGEYASS